MGQGRTRQVLVPAGWTSIVGGFSLFLNASVAPLLSRLFVECQQTRRFCEAGRGRERVVFQRPRPISTAINPSASSLSWLPHSVS